MGDEGRFGYVPRTEPPHAVLGIPPPDEWESLTDNDVASAYRRASLKAHPDKPGGNKEKFDRIKKAYELVKTKERRESFVRYGSRLQPGPGDNMGETVDQILPLVIGMLAGVYIVISTVGPLDAKNSLNIFVAIWLALSSGAALAQKNSNCDGIYNWWNRYFF
mmetsp:Transcript_18548/g.28632  ORF Transcript_18548/g.28632 Transcript_18548/m.28632 type:complete len:163 (-) Transcript_18548:142-630(-)